MKLATITMRYKQIQSRRSLFFFQGQGRGVACLRRRLVLLSFHPNPPFPNPISIETVHLGSDFAYPNLAKNDICRNLSTLQTINTLTGCEAALRILMGVNFIAIGQLRPVLLCSVSKQTGDLSTINL